MAAIALRKYFCCNSPTMYLRVLVVIAALAASVDITSAVPVGNVPLYSVDSSLPSGNGS